MKLIKKVFGFLIALILLLCAGITVCAFYPALTEALAAQVGKLNTGSESRQQAEAQAPGESEEGLMGYVADSVELPDAADIGRLISARESGQLPNIEAYIASGEEDIKAPQGVRDKLGLEPVSDVSREIGEEAANALQQDLDTGNVGADYSFDALAYPYYEMLEGVEQDLYRQIYANAWDLTTSFVPAVEVDVDQVKKVFEAMYNDHPELFWLETGYSCQYLKNGRPVEISLKYNRTVNDLENAREVFEEAAEKILSGALELGSDYEKEKYVHDALISQAEYDTRAAMSQSAYSALVNHKSVCAGYSRAYQYLLQRLGIPCYYCTGYSGGDHAWNIVRLSDGYYNVDTTWDDTNPATYDYFNKTDRDYATTHVRKGLSVNLPACMGSEYHNLENGAPGQIAEETNVQEEEDATGETAQTNAQPEHPEDAEEPITYINENPIKPLTVETKPVATQETSTENADTTFALEDYYADCLNQMVAVGAGEKQFVNVIPQALWDAVERSYSDGSYKSGYVNAGLEKLGMEHFAIQLQVQRLGDGYYRLYHNIATW